MKRFRLVPIAAALLRSALRLPRQSLCSRQAEFHNDEQRCGTADLSEGPKGVVIRVNVEGLAPGWHGIHFHAVGDCSDEGFQKSGGHTHHESERPPHGLLNPEGPDDGDLPNIYANENGVAQAELYSPFVTLTGAEGRAMLLDEDGAALVIHEGPDDHMSQPIGGAGARVACAVIKPVE